MNDVKLIHILTMNEMLPSFPMDETKLTEIFKTESRVRQVRASNRWIRVLLGSTMPGIGGMIHEFLTAEDMTPLAALVESGIRVNERAVELSIEPSSKRRKTQQPAVRFYIDLVSGSRKLDARPFLTILKKTYQIAAHEAGSDVRVSFRMS